MSLDLDIFRIQGAIVVRCSGRIVFGDESDELRRTILSLLGESKQLVLNLAWVAHIDSTGLGTLVASFISATHHGGEIKLAGLSPLSERLLKTTNLDRLFDVYRSSEEAVESFLTQRQATG